MLDTFYTEVEGWLELTDVYASCHQCVFVLSCVSSFSNETLLRYTLALQALTHALLLAPQNPLHVLYFAELAFLVPDIPLALKMYLQAVDMTDDDDQDGIAPSDTVPTGMVLRAWFGVKLVSLQILAQGNLAKASFSARTSLRQSRKHPCRRHKLRVRLPQYWLRSMNLLPNDLGQLTWKLHANHHRMVTGHYSMLWPRLYLRDVYYIDHCFSRFTLPYPETYDRFKLLR